jgi:hypothetical protein
VNGNDTYCCTRVNDLKILVLDRESSRFKQPGLILLRQHIIIVVVIDKHLLLMIITTEDVAVIFLLTGTVDIDASLSEVDLKDFILRVPENNRIGATRVSSRCVMMVTLVLSSAVLKEDQTCLSRSSKQKAP